MRNLHARLAAMFVACLLFASVHAQKTTITGNVKTAADMANLPNVSVLITGTGEGTTTDASGNFSISTSKKPPIEVTFSYVGYATQQVTYAGSPLNIQLVFGETLGGGVVVSATRTPTRILESPVSIERVNSANITAAPATNYYDIVRNLKGVDVVYSSLTYGTPTTRGFSNSGNTRFTQIVNGMDNQAPGLNFAVGSVIGLSELDVESMEILPGASSALYGPGGINGTLLITGKNPFTSEGLSFLAKTGLMHVGQRNERPTSPYFNWNLRWAKKINERLAFKVAAEVVQAKDWLANDYRNYKRLGSSGNLIDGTRETDPNYDGINVYGDETSINLKSQVLSQIALQAPFLAGYINTLPDNLLVSRTGYTEKEVANPNTVNFKVSGAIHYKITKGIEASLSGHYGTGSTIYTGSQRYSLKDLKMGQYKLELNHKNWFLRGYTTQENSGESHNLTIATQLFNEAWKPSSVWYSTYGQTYLNAKLSGRPDLEAHNAARAAADQGRPVAGSEQFKTIYDQVRKRPIPQGGLFLDRTDLYMVEGQYNLTDVVKFAEVLVGANWKKYVLNSQGTLFADKVGDPIGIWEYGAYLQVSKEVWKEYLKLTVSGRYDKNENFKGRFTPRVTALIKPAKDHNIRLSFQTAYRFPSTQQQWIDLDVGTGRLMGGVKFLWDKYNMINNPVYSVTSLQAGAPVVSPYVPFKPESVVSYEVGYKSLIAKQLLVDAYLYFSEYKDFLSRIDVVQKKNANGPITDLNDPSKRNGYSIVVNAPGKVKAIGWGIGLDYLLPADFVISGNFSSDELNNVPTGFRAFFNSPKYRSNISLSNNKLGKKKNLGFNVSWRWQDAFYYDSDFANGDVAAFNTLDAQFSVRIPNSKSVFKIGATNLLNEYYQTATGNPSIGGLYYVSYGFNVR